MARDKYYFPRQACERDIMEIQPFIFKRTVPVTTSSQKSDVIRVPHDKVLRLIGHTGYNTTGSDLWISLHIQKLGYADQQVTALGLVNGQLLHYPLYILLEPDDLLRVDYGAVVAGTTFSYIIFGELHEYKKG